MHTIDVDVASAGATPIVLRVRAWPAGVGPAPFVLVHGLSSNARLWDPVAEILAAAGHEVFAVDLRSHGDSDTPPGGYDTNTAASDVARVCTALGRRAAVVVGQSWGGNVVVRLAAQHPALVAAIGLIDGGWVDPRATFPDWDSCVAALRPADVDGLLAADLRHRIKQEHPQWTDAAVDATLANLRTLPDGTVRRRLSIDNHLRILRSLWDDPPWPDLAAITAPTLVMPAVPADPGGSKRDAVTKTVAALKRVRVREYVGGDHDLHAQQPQAVAADLLALAEEVR